MFPKIPPKKRFVYLDHAAATPLDERVFKAMKPFFSLTFANPSSLYEMGVKAKKALDAARSSVAHILQTQADTIVFTSGGTESDNLAIMGAALVNKNYGKHIITTAIEHDAVLRTVEDLKKNHGFSVTYLEPDKYGFITPEQVKKALRKDTVLVSVMYANNEIGTILPIAEIGKEILKWRKRTPSGSPLAGGGLPLFHTDAAQAPGALELSVEKLHVDLMTLNGGKMYGPKGTGVLYKRRGVRFEPKSYGGRQEFGFRAGTENVPGVVGFARALEFAEAERQKNVVAIKKLRDYFWKQLKLKIKDVELNGPSIETENKKAQKQKNSFEEFVRLPNNLNVSFQGVEAEVLMFYLDSFGVMCSTGSACSTDSNEPSHVLMAIAQSKENAESSLRFTLGKNTSKADIDYVLKFLPHIVKELRNLN